MSESTYIDELDSFTKEVSEALKEGKERLKANDTTLIHSVVKLERHRGMLLRLSEPIANHEVKEQLQALAEVVGDFLEACKEVAASSTLEDEEVPKSPPRVCRSGRVGRPQIELNTDEVLNCRSTGMSWTSIAKKFGVSRGTLYSRKRMFPAEAQVTDAELVQSIKMLKAENPQVGQRYVSGYLLANDKRATRKRVREALRIVDPVGTVVNQRMKIPRVGYFSKGPNYNWHMDGNEKLQPFGIYIHSVVDGDSHLLIYLVCLSNKKAENVLKLFKAAVKDFGFPKIVRSDKGKENVEVAKYVLKKRGVDSRGFITGRSVHNIRVERSWPEVNKVTRRYRILLYKLWGEEVFDLSNKLHKYAIHYVYLPRIQRSLDIFAAQFNFHSMSSEFNRTPADLYFNQPRAKVDVSDSEDAETDNDDLETNEDFECAAEQEQLEVAAGISDTSEEELELEASEEELEPEASEEEPEASEEESEASEEESEASEEESEASDEDLADSEDDSDFNFSHFESYAKQIVPDPLAEDGSNGANHLKCIINELHKDL